MNGMSNSQQFVAAQQKLVAEFTKYRESLWQAVYFRLDHRLAGRVDPDDVLQEAWLDANNRLKQYIGERGSWAMIVWIRVILKQTLVNVHRRHFSSKKRDASREVVRSRDSQESELPTMAEICVGRNSTPSQVLIQKESCSKLEHVLSQLKPNDKKILELRHFEELSNKESAKVLGLNEKAASIRYVRAIERLKKAMGSEPILD